MMGAVDFNRTGDNSRTLDKSPINNSNLNNATNG